MTSLYTITEELSEILSAMDDEEVPADIEAKLDALSLAHEAKIDGVLRFRVALLARAEGMENELERLTKLQQAIENQAERLREYVKQSLEKLGVSKMATALFNLRIQKNSRPSISLLPGEEVPEGFKKTKIEFDGQLAYELWKKGQGLPNSIKVKQGDHLRIT